VFYDGDTDPHDNPQSGTMPDPAIAIRYSYTEAFFMHRMQQALWIGFIAAALSSASFAADQDLPYFERGDLTPYWAPASQGAGGHAPAGLEPFSAIDQAGKAATERDFSGGVSVVNFFFAQCGNTCPRMMSTIARFQGQLKKDGLSSKVAIYSFSTMPEHDTPAVLRKYAEARGLDLANWRLLTGKRKEIYRVGKAMLKADRAVGSQKSPTTFIHSEYLYLLDQNRRVRGIYDSSSPAQMADLRKDIRRLTAT
jgi:protein SCO1/2